MTQAAAAGWGFGFDTWTFGHDRAGQTIALTDPPNGGAPARTTTIDRNPDGTVAQQALHSGAAGSSVIDQWSYTYDATGRVGSRARSGAGMVSESYGYDEAGRLATINGGQINYDPNGNRLSGPDMPTLTFRADNSIATGPGPNGSGTETYLHTPWGGLTRDACRTYGYDGFDRASKTDIRRQLLGLVPACNPIENLLSADDTKRYDALGRHIWSRHDRIDLLGNPTVTEYNNVHHVGLTQTVAYKQTVGAPARSGRYVNTPTGVPLAVSDNNGNLQFLHRDGQHNTVAALEPDGQPACAPDMDPWGDSDNDPCTGLISTDSPNERWYNSSRLDTATGTYQWGNRTYNPTTATWQQPDTSHGRVAPSQVSIGSATLVANRIAYVNGDPINYIDPSGHWPELSGWTGDCGLVPCIDDDIETLVWVGVEKGAEWLIEKSIDWVFKPAWDRLVDDVVWLWDRVIDVKDLAADTLHDAALLVIAVGMWSKDTVPSIATRVRDFILGSGGTKEELPPYPIPGTTTTTKTTTTPGSQDHDCPEGLIGTHRELRRYATRDCQRHHIIQDVTVRDRSDRYDRNDAISILLHNPLFDSATRVQRDAVQGGTYGDELDVANAALTAAGIDPSLRSDAIERADAYFAALGFTESTITNIPRNRRRAR
jgi:RHS repeat-associated protein